MQMTAPSVPLLGSSSRRRGRQHRLRRARCRRCAGARPARAGSTAGSAAVARSARARRPAVRQPGRPPAAPRDRARADRLASERRVGRRRARDWRSAAFASVADVRQAPARSSARRRSWPKRKQGWSGFCSTTSIAIPTCWRNAAMRQQALREMFDVLVATTRPTAGEVSPDRRARRRAAGRGRLSGRHDRPLRPRGASTLDVGQADGHWWPSRRLIEWTEFGDDADR